MHIPDAYLSPATELVAYGVMIPLWTIAARKTARELTSRQTPLLSIGAAFCFAIQMFNIPAVGGTTAHALGAALLAILVGPWSAMLGMTLTLVTQALMFGDGGILSLGANCFNMAFVAPFAAHFVYRTISAKADFGSARGLIGAGAGAYAGAIVASLSAAVMLGIQPLVAHDALGHALYFPFGLGVSIPSMLMTHLLVAGPAEAIVTVAALSYLWRAMPELLIPNARPKLGATTRLATRMIWILALSPLGLIAAGSAWGEWDMDQIKSMVGYVPRGMAGSRELVHPVLADYGFAGMAGRPWEIAGYLASALIGSLVIALFIRSVLRRRPAETLPMTMPGKSTGDLPAWMHFANPASPPTKVTKAPWFEATLLKMRATVAKAIATEDVARSQGFLQSIHPTAKAVAFLSALIATGLASSMALLLSILAGALVAAFFSAVPMRGFLARVLGSVAFFGLVFAIPVCFATVTPGPVAFRLGVLEISESGVRMATLILLRLGTGITLAMLWNLTTQWHLMLKSLGSLGIPRSVLSAATLTYRYLFVMMETLGDMVEARTARQVGACDKSQARSYAGAGVAVLFAKSLALTEETHLAMQARGFEIAAQRPRSHPWRLADSATVLTGLSMLVFVLLKGAFHAI